jgi:hypothetical protein
MILKVAVPRVSPSGQELSDLRAAGVRNLNTRRHDRAYSVRCI